MYINVYTGSSDLAKIENITVTPNPPKKGKTLTITGTVDLSESDLLVQYTQNENRDPERLRLKYCQLWLHYHYTV